MKIRKNNEITHTTKKTKIRQEEKIGMKNKREKEKIKKYTGILLG